ncbi:MAG: class I SAM-dependent methyltransferase [Bdellovibrionota bacterium]
MLPKEPSPALFFETINAYHRTAALKGAVELGIFSVLGQGSTAADIAKSCNATERGIRILCDYLTIAGFLKKKGERYSNTPDSEAFLRKDSRTYVGGTLQFLLSDQLQESFRDVAGCVKRGGTLLEGAGTVDPDDPVWVDFAQGMAPMMMPAALDLASLVPQAVDQPIRVLDIAAGHGIFGITIAKRFPKAEITAVDWRAVLEVAKENARRFEVADRYKTIAGSAFEADFSEGYDVVLLTNFLHHFNPAQNEALLGRVKKALKPGGRALTLEFVPNEDRVSPPSSAAFSMVMLCSTPEGDAYTFAELEKMFEHAGFAKSTLVELPSGMQRAVVSEVA